MARLPVSKQLPEYMVPSHFVVLKALPLTPSGKLDRRALPIPDVNTRTIENKYVAPRTSIEKQLVAIWQELLNIKEIGIEDNFFQLGGHSLIATQLMARVKEQYFVELPFKIYL